MEELDFSKIFGETATSKASFTNENYISGWGHLVSTPPPYQLFDYLQGLNDKKSKYLYDSLNESKSNLLAHNTDTTAHSPILNAIKAITGMSAYDVAPSKTISAIIPLLGFGGIVAQNLATNGYVKFANGFTIQWGDGGFNGTNLYLDVSFPIAFANQTLLVCPFDRMGGVNVSYTTSQSLVWNDTATTTTKFRVTTNFKDIGNIGYIAIGF